MVVFLLPLKAVSYARIEQLDTDQRDILWIEINIVEVKPLLVEAYNRSPKSDREYLN